MNDKITLSTLFNPLLVPLLEGHYRITKLRRKQKMKYQVIVPPTKEVGSYSCVVSGSNYREDALWDYNSARAHDGLEPINRMPKGTQYIKAQDTTFYEKNKAK